MWSPQEDVTVRLIGDVLTTSRLELSALPLQKRFSITADVGACAFRALWPQIQAIISKLPPHKSRGGRQASASRELIAFRS